MFFKRLSRSRSNSQSYVDNYNSPHDSKTNSASFDYAGAGGLPPSSLDKYNSPTSAGAQEITPILGENDLLPSSRQSDNALNDGYGKDSGMYARKSQEAYGSPPVSAGGGAPVRGLSNGYGTSGGYDDAAPAALAPRKETSAPPDLLLQAFNQALRPHMDKVDSLENEIADLRAYIEQLEAQRGEVHAWIDKRGLRPDVPPNIAAQMDSSSHSASPTHAASTLNAQLDRKITIVNFDLHRLQDDLNDSLPTPSFSACMLKFLPDIQRLSSLPSGPRYAFDLLLKLGGNLNSHGGLENGDADDLAERRAFYGQLDEAMVDVVRGRFKEEGDSWGVQREIKRIEKTGAYLRNWGVEPYFPHTLDVMRSESSHSGTGGSEPPNYA